jgi:hypothetical protein
VDVSAGALAQVDWMKDGGPTENYAQAKTSPRKVRLVLNS